MSWSRSKVKRHTSICRFWKIWGNPSPPISPRLEHIIITGMFNTYLELVLHQVPWEEAVLYLEEMQAFYTAGWMKLMGQE